MYRAVFIDLAKAICIVLVVIGHYDPACEPNWWAEGRKFIYLFHMPLFIFASGYVYRLSSREGVRYGAFVWKKVRRLMVPYLVVSWIVISLKLLFQQGLLVESPVTFSSYVRAFFYPEAGYFLWFLWSLMEMFLLAPLLVRGKWGEVLFFGLALLVYFLPVELPRVFCLAQTKYYWVYFAAGVWAGRLFVPGMAQEYGVFWNKFCRFFSSTAGLLWVTLLFLPVAWAVSVGWVQLVSGSMASLALSLGLGLAGTVWVCLLCLHIERGGHGGRGVRLLQVLGASSFVIYLFHTTFMGGAKSLLHKFFPFLSSWGEAGFLIGAVCVVWVGVVFPLLLQRWVLSRSRIARMLFGLK